MAKKAAIASTRVGAREAQRAKERTKKERTTSSASVRVRPVGRRVGCPQRWHDGGCYARSAPSVRAPPPPRRGTPPAAHPPRRRGAAAASCVQQWSAHDPFHVFLLQRLVRLRRRGCGIAAELGTARRGRATRLVWQMDKEERRKDEVGMHPHRRRCGAGRLCRRRQRLRPQPCGSGFYKSPLRPFRAPLCRRR